MKVCKKTMRVLTCLAPWLFLFFVEAQGIMGRMKEHKAFPWCLAFPVKPSGGPGPSRIGPQKRMGIRHHSNYNFCMVCVQYKETDYLGSCSFFYLSPGPSP